MLNRFFTMPESPICPLCGFGTDDWLILEAHFKEHHNIRDPLDAPNDEVMSSTFLCFQTSQNLNVFEENEIKNLHSVASLFGNTPFPVIRTKKGSTYPDKSLLCPVNKESG